MAPTKTFSASKILTCLSTENLCLYSHLEGENTTQTETGMSKIIERPTSFPKTSLKKHLLRKCSLKMHLLQV